MKPPRKLRSTIKPNDSDDLLADPNPNSRDRDSAKRKTYPSPVLSNVKRSVGLPPKQSKDCSDKGIGSSLDPLNDSTAQSVESHKLVPNSKQFDWNQFSTSVLDQLKCKENKEDGANIDSTKMSVKPLKKSMTDIMSVSDDNSEDELIVENISAIDCNQSEELDDSRNPLMIYEDRNHLTDKDYQIDCFNKSLEMLKRDGTDSFKIGLKARALQTLNSRELPSGGNITPIIRFNMKGEPNFEFYFSMINSPFNIRETVPFDNQIIELSKIIYDYITLPIKPKGCHKCLV